MKSKHFKLEGKLEELSKGKMKKVYGGKISSAGSRFFDDCSCNSVSGCGVEKPKKEEDN